jgi:hypothetical protein
MKNNKQIIKEIKKEIKEEVNESERDNIIDEVEEEIKDEMLDDNDKIKEIEDEIRVYLKPIVEEKIIKNWNKRKENQVAKKLLEKHVLDNL